MRDDGPHARAGLSDLERRMRDADRSIEAPPFLVERIESALQERGMQPARRSRHLVAIARIAAAVAVLATAALLNATLHRRTPPRPAEPIGAASAADEVAPAIVRFAPDSNHFARTIPTTRPNITVVRIYRGVGPAAAPEPTEGSES